MEGGGYTPQDPYGLFGIPPAGSASGRARPGGPPKEAGDIVSGSFPQKKTKNNEGGRGGIPLSILHRGI